MILSVLLAVAGSLTVKMERPLEIGLTDHLGELRRFDVALPKPMDLSDAAGVTFSMRCEDPSALTACWLLFQTGDGDYRAKLEIPSQAGMWMSRTVLRKAVRLYHWNTHVSLRELHIAPRPEDLPDWSRVRGFQVVFALAIDRLSPDATVSVRDFSPVAVGSAEALAAKESLARREAEMAAAMRDFPPRSGERRFLATHAYGLDWDWESTCSLLAKHGITDVIPLTSYAGRSYYRSACEPPHPLVESRGDAVRQCIAACRKNGQKCHPWRCCWQLGEVLSVAERAKLLQEGRLQVDSEGKADYHNFLCPTHPENVRHEIDALMGLANMGATGIMLDYFRYPGQDFCLCARCRSRFEKSLGRRVADWQEVVSPEGPLNRQWQDFRRMTLTGVLRTVRQEMRRRAPHVELSAAVFSTPDSAAGLGQDWPGWCQEGLLDWLFPMSYYASDRHFEHDIVLLRAAVAGSKTGMIPMLALACGAIPFNDPVEMARQISVVRRAGCPGLAFFRLEEYFPFVFDMLGKGPLK